MDRNAFNERERALEDEFFFRVDKELLSKLRKQLTDEAARNALASASGFSDETLLNELVQLGVSPDTLGSLALAPIVLVAWSDRRVDPDERLTALATAAAEGIFVGGPAYKLLEFWLANEPGRQLGETWKHYVHAVMNALSADAKAILREEVLRKARMTAMASGGGVCIDKISPSEQRVLKELEAALSC